MVESQPPNGLAVWTVPWPNAENGMMRAAAERGEKPRQTRDDVQGSILRGAGWVADLKIACPVVRVLIGDALATAAEDGVDRDGALRPGERGMVFI